MKDCIFCKISEGALPSYKIYEDELTYAFLDIACDAYGHTLVIPKKHFENIFDCDDSTLSAVINTVQKISRHYVNDCGFDGVDVLNADGKEAGQTVFHLHFHVVPRKKDDGLDAWPFKKKYGFDLEEVCKKLVF